MSVCRTSLIDDVQLPIQQRRYHVPDSGDWRALAVAIPTPSPHLHKLRQILSGNRTGTTILKFSHEHHVTQTSQIPTASVTVNNHDHERMYDLTAIFQTAQPIIRQVPSCRSQVTYPIIELRETTTYIGCCWAARAVRK